MLNPFPIQFLSLFAYFLLRICVGGILVYFGWTHLRHREKLAKKIRTRIFPYTSLLAWIFCVAELVIGTMFILGFYTQIAALLTMALSLKLIVLHKRFASPFIQGRLFYLLFFFCSLSLFITGAGAFAFDLPI